MNDDTPTGPKWIPAFLATLAETGTVGRAIEAARISAGAVYHQRKINLRFVEDWRAALAASPRAAAQPKVARPRQGGWRVVFLEVLAETSNVTASAIRANVPLQTVYKVRRADAAFAAEWLAALHHGYDMLEMELLGYLRDPAPTRKMDVAAALRLLAAHRETVARERALREDDDEQAVLDSIDQFIEDMRQRRLANTAILLEAEQNDGEG